MNLSSILTAYKSVKTMIDFMKNPLDFAVELFTMIFTGIFGLIKYFTLYAVSSSLNIKYEILADPLFHKAYVFFGTIAICVLLLKLAIEFFKSKLLRLTNVDYHELFFLAIINVTFILFAGTIYSKISEFFDAIVEGLINLNSTGSTSIVTQLTAIDPVTIIQNAASGGLTMIFAILLSFAVMQIFIITTYVQQVIRQIKLALLFLFIPYVATQNMGSTVGTYQSWKQEIKNLFGSQIIQLLMLKLSIGYLLSHSSNFFSTSILDLHIDTKVIVICLFYYTYKCPEFVRKFIDSGTSGNWIDAGKRMVGNVAANGATTAVTSVIKSFIK